MKKELFLLFLLLLFISNTANAKTSQKQPTAESLLRVVGGYFEQQKNMYSNLQLYSTNYGIFGHNIESTTGGGIWPRGSLNQYIYGGGLWFAAEKKYFSVDSGNYQYRKMCEITYNPSSGRSWFVPGSIEDGDTIVQTPNAMKKYRTYYSSDFYKSDGTPYNNNDGPNWPIWKTENTNNSYFGASTDKYIFNENERTNSHHPLGVSMISDEDIVTYYKDTDLSYFDGGIDLRKQLGYPLGLQVEERTYSWGQGDLKDVVFLCYLVKNVSKDTLYNCWIGGVFDVDIGQKPSPTANNDRMRYLFEDTTLYMGITWTNVMASEEDGQGFGYCGVSMIESPAVDAKGFIINQNSAIPKEKQIGLFTYKNWLLLEDLETDESRYNAMSFGVRDGDNGGGDKRMMLTSGPFHFIPGAVARVVFCINFAMPAKGGEADGTVEDVTGFYNSQMQQQATSHLKVSPSSVVGKQMMAQNYYYNGSLSSVKEENNKKFSINVYPNPANKNIIVSYYVEYPSVVRIGIYDHLGRLVQDLLNSYEDTGNYQQPFTLDHNKFSNGLYFLKIQNGNDTRMTKLMLNN